MMEVVNDNTCSWINDLTPRSKKIIDIINDHSLNSSPLINGYVAIIKKTTKNTIPKLLLEPILISSI